MKPSVKDSDGQQEYQEVPLPNPDAVVDKCKKHVLADIEKLHKAATQLD